MMMLLVVEGFTWGSIGNWQTVPQERSGRLQHRRGGALKVNSNVSAINSRRLVGNLMAHVRNRRLGSGRLPSRRYLFRAPIGRHRHRPALKSLA